MTPDEKKAKAKAYREANKDKIKAYREANKDKIALQNKLYREKNREALNLYDRERWDARKESLKPKAKAWREKNKEYLKQVDKERYENNKEAHYERCKAWATANADRVKEYHRNYYEENKERIRERTNKWARENSSRLYAKRMSNPNNRISHNLRTRLYQAIGKNYKAGSAVKDLGCSVSEFREYISKLFTEGMSWDNYGEWHLDHVIPLASFDLSDREQFLQAAHYTNYQPLWAADNIRKGAQLAYT